MAIDAKYVDLTLMSGSADVLRRTVGGYYYVLDTSTATEDNAVLEYVGLDEEKSTVGEYGDAEIEIVDIDSPFTKIITSYKRVENVHKDTLITSYQVPVRMYGNSDYIDSDREWDALFGRFDPHDRSTMRITSVPYDDDTFQRSYPYTLYNQRVLASKDALSEGTSAGDESDAITIGYDYNLYLKNYQRYIANNYRPEYKIPNYYFINLAAAGEDIYDEMMLAINREGAIEETEVLSIMSELVTPYLPPTHDTTETVGGLLYTDRSYNLRKYLSSSLSLNALSGTTETYLSLVNQNLFFDEDIYSQLYDTIEQNKELCPYYVKIEFPYESENYADTYTEVTDDQLASELEEFSFRKSIYNNGFDQRFLKLLKESFLNERPNIQLKNKTYAKNINYFSGSEAESAVYNIEETDTVSYPSINFLDLLGISHNDFYSRTFNSCFVGEKTADRLAVYDEDGTYRFANTISTVKVLSDTIKYLTNNSDISKITSIGDLYKLSEDKYTETLAYRVQKIKGPGPTNLREAPTLQNFWFKNRQDDFVQTSDPFSATYSALTEKFSFGGSLIPSYARDDTPFHFIDNQVLYGEDYTYAVYAYVLVVGVKYRFSDMRVTQQIGSVDMGDGTERYCLQFHEPGILSEPVDQLYSAAGTDILTDGSVVSAGQSALFWEALAAGGTTTSTTSGELLLDMDGNEYVGDFYVSGVVSAYGTPDYNAWEIYEIDSSGNIDTSRPLTWLTIVNRFATDAQITSTEPYIADMYLNYEPTVKIVEIPIASKTIRVQDHLPAKMEVAPSYVLNDSQRITFKLDCQTETPGEFPVPIEIAEEVYRNNYISSNSLLEDSIIEEFSESPPTLMEIYRTKNKPKTVDDFQGALHQQVSLRINEDFHSYVDSLTFATFHDRIKTNTKYYYLFRVVNEQGIAGFSSEIYEAELVSDGGYKYATFEVLLQDHLDPPEPKLTPFKLFKKLMQPKPSPEQITLFEDNVDFSQSAQEQIQNVVIGNPDLEDPIWGKTFKIRLTSKKTGKKIDLNITYNLESD